MANVNGCVAFRDHRNVRPIKVGRITVTCAKVLALADFVSDAEFARSKF